MEATNVLHSVVVFAAQHKNQPTETSLENLHRHLDILLGLSKQVDIKLFDQNHFAVTEFFAAITDFVTDSEPNTALVQKIFYLLQNLVQCPSLKDALSSVFHLYSPLFTFLQNFGVSEREPLVAQCLNLIADLSNNFQVPYIDTQLENILQILLLHVCTTTKLTRPCIEILSNLCRNNSVVESYIKRLPNNKELMKSLASRVSDTNPLLALPSLSVLAMVRKGDWGEKLFQAPNIFRTFEFILYNVLGEDTSKKSCAAKLLCDLLKIPSVRTEMFGRYGGIVPSLQKALQKFNETNSGSSYVLQFLLTLTDNSSSHISSVLLEDGQLLKELLSKLLFWIGQKDDGEMSELAIRFLKLLLLELQPHNCIPEQDLDAILKLLADETKPDLDFNSLLIGRYLQKLKLVADLMMVLSEEEALKPKIAQYVTADVCRATMSNLIDHYQPQLNDSDNCGIDIMLVLLCLAGNLKDCIPDMDDVIQNVTQSSKFVWLLAEGFTSPCPFRVQQSLNVSRISDFPPNLLGQTIAKLNDASKSHNSSELEKTLNVSPCQKRQRESLEGSVSDLIHKVQDGLNLREIRSSEMMDVYEYKISNLQERESQLQELLDAKSLALQKADQILSEQKCKQALREGEALRLRKLLRESEERSETSREQMNQALGNQRKCQQNLNTLQEDMSQLRRQNEDLKDQTTQQEHDNFILQEKCKNLQADYSMQSENNALLHKHNDEMKQKIDLLNQDVSSLTLEKKQLVKHLKEKETKLTELNENMLKTTENLAIKEEANDGLQADVFHLKEMTASLTSDKANLEQEATSLGILCRQHETALKERDLVIRRQHDELAELQNLNKMIHELSSKASLKKE